MFRIFRSKSQDNAVTSSNKLEVAQEQLTFSILKKKYTKKILFKISARPHEAGCKMQVLESKRVNRSSHSDVKVQLQESQEKTGN